MYLYIDIPICVMVLLYVARPRQGKLAWFTLPAETKGTKITSLRQKYPIEETSDKSFFFKLNMVRAKGKATKDKGKKKRKSKSKDSFTELRINLLPFC